MLSEFLFIHLGTKRMLACCDMFNSFLRRRCFSLSTFPSCYATVISRRFSYGHASNDGTRRTNDKGRKIQKSLRVMKTSGTMQEQEHEQLSMGGNTGEGEVEEKVDCLLPWAPWLEGCCWCMYWKICLPGRPCCRASTLIMLFWWPAEGWWGEGSPKYFTL